MIPALLVGRLAVATEHAGLGPGSALVAWAFSIAVEVNSSVACRVVVVNAMDHAARRCWLRRGFQPFTDDPASERYYDLYVPTRQLETLIRRR